MPVPTQMPSALRPARRAQPGLAQRPQVAVVAHRHGHMEAAFQVGPDRHAGQTHVGRDHHAGGVRIDHARHGDAQGRQVGVATLPFRARRR